MVEIQAPLVESQFFTLNAGREDEKFCYGSFTCLCTLHDGQPCSTRYTIEQLLDMRMHHLSMARDELDIVVLAKISTAVHLDATTITTKQKEQSVRNKIRSDYRHEGHKICRDTFMFMHAIFKDRLAALHKHYHENGVSPRVHGNKGNQPAHALTPDDCQRVVDFIFNYAEQNAVLLPGRIPGYRRDDLKLLPSSISKAAVHQQYGEACAKGGFRQLAKKTFLKLWTQYCPYVVPMKPRSDLCWTCQQNSSNVVRAANRPDDDKSVALLAAMDHLNKANAERSLYTAQVAESKAAAAAAGLTKLEEPGNNLADCSRDVVAHYSFDFAQQVHYPANPLQPGPIYFKTPRKCGLFGMMTEGLPQMVLFLVDEATVVSKGANGVISMVDYFFENYGLKETILYLHADNCSGQNKNNAMIHYLLWRVMTGKHREIHISFMLAGHTKFAPDWCFGLFKRKFRLTKVDCLADISAVAKACSSSGVLLPQLCGNEDGLVFVPTYAWDTHLFPQTFKKLPSIKKYHHFLLKADGSVTCKMYVDSEPVVYHLLQVFYKLYVLLIHS